MLVLAALIGVLVSLASWAFLELVHLIQEWVYHDLPGELGFAAAPWWWPLPVMAVAGVLTAVAVLSPASGLHGLTPRELEVLGLLVEGCSNQEIARTLVVAPRTAAAHLEHVLAKLGAPTRTLAAVRAEREGLYVPALPRRPSPAT